MKTKIRVIFFLLTFIMFITSCNNEEIFEEQIIEQQSEEPNPDEESEDEDEDEDEEEVADTDTPCSFNLDNIQPNSTVVIDCNLDLGNSIVNLPENVIIEYAGGDIINGTLNFSGGTIGGELLNSTLTISGSNTQLKDTSFDFLPERWGIVEGQVSDEVARNNRDILNLIMQNIKDLGVDTFKIDTIDAYFKTDGVFNKTVPQDEAIIVPSDFNLIMTDNTHLRVQPNNYQNTVLLTVFNVANVLIEGGNLHGDRDTHDYTEGTHEWGHVVLLKACNSVVLRGVTILDAGGDAIDINAFGHSHDSFYTRSHNILITENKLIRSRRNHLSITDGYDIIVENNEFIDASIHTDKSNGVAPGFAIDVEAIRPNEEAEDIIVRNNIERGSRVGGFTVHTGNRVTFDSNQMESVISYSTSIGTIIKNNVFIANEQRALNGTAIVAGRNDRYDSNYGNRVFGNKIYGYSIGIKGTNTDLEVYDNEINNCNWSIILDKIRNSSIYRNIIRSTNENSDGLVSHPTADYMDNINIYENDIEVDRVPFKLVSINQETNQSDYKCLIENNVFKGSVVLSKTHGFTYKDNTINQGQLQIVNSNNIDVIDGDINALTLSNGIRFIESNSNINISGVTIKSASSSCISDTSDVLNIQIDNVICNN